jgi:hypothetical protein
VGSRAARGRRPSKACSFLCTNHVGSNVVHDPGFLDPMRRYQELYAEYSAEALDYSPSGIIRCASPYRRFSKNLTAAINSAF